MQSQKEQSYRRRGQEDGPRPSRWPCCLTFVVWGCIFYVFAFVTTVDPATVESLSWQREQEVQVLEAMDLRGLWATRNFPAIFQHLSGRRCHWVSEQWLQSSGSNAAPAWPEVDIASADSRSVGARRLGDFRAKYTACLGHAAKRICVDLPEDEWSGLREGQRVLHFRNLFGVTRKVEAARISS